MKGHTIAFATLFACGASATSFGPQNCVSLARSAGGSCVITTDCQGLDTSKTEFAFDCAGAHGELVRHSFGVGGFEANEEFDTEVKCTGCNSIFMATHTKKKTRKADKVDKVEKLVKVEAPPSEQTLPHGTHSPLRPLGKWVSHSLPVPKVEESTQPVEGAMALKVDQKRQVPSITGDDKEAVRYGPQDCVSTYKSSEGHCIMSTQCKDVSIASYEFGLVCVDSKGYPVKHLFGKGSFDEEETFDTLVKCDKCLGLENIPDAVTLAGDVATMAKDVAYITAVTKNISMNVQMLNAKVFPPQPKSPAPAPAGAAPAEALPPKKTKFMIRQHVNHGHLRRHHRHRHHDSDYDNDEEEREDRREDREDRRDDYQQEQKQPEDNSREEEEDHDGYDS